MHNVRERKKYPASTYPKKKKNGINYGVGKKLKHIPNHPLAPKVKWLAPKGKFI